MIKSERGAIGFGNLQEDPFCAARCGPFEQISRQAAADPGSTRGRHDTDSQNFPFIHHGAAYGKAAWRAGPLDDRCVNRRVCQ